MKEELKEKVKDKKERKNWHGTFFEFVFSYAVELLFPAILIMGFIVYSLMKKIGLGL